MPVPGTAPETPLKANGNPPRKLMRVLIVSQATLFFSEFIPGLSESDLINPEDWSESLLGLVILGFILWYMLRWTWRAWDQPTGKSDRVILILGITLLIGSPFDAVTRALPSPWADYWDTAKTILVFPLVFWAYRKLERKWTEEGDLLALAELGPWPTNRHFLYGISMIIIFELLSLLPDFEDAKTPEEPMSEWLVVLVSLLALGFYLLLFRYGWKYLREKKIVS